MHTTPPPAATVRARRRASAARTTLLLAAILSACGGGTGEAPGDVDPQGSGEAPAADGASAPPVTPPPAQIPDPAPTGDPLAEATDGAVPEPAATDPTLAPVRRVAVVRQILEVYSGRAWDARLTGFTYPADAEDGCDGGLGTHSTGSSRDAATHVFEACRLGADTLDGRVTLALDPAAGTDLTFAGFELRFDPDGRMSLDGRYRRVDVAAAASTDTVTQGLDYRFAYPGGTLDVETARTFHTLSPGGVRFGGAFEMRAPATGGARVRVSSSVDFDGTGSAAAFPAAGRLEATAEDGSRLSLDAGNGDPDTVRVVATAPDGTAVTADEPWTLWADALTPPPPAATGDGGGAAIPTDPADVTAGIDVEATLAALSLPGTAALAAGIDAHVARIVADAGGPGAGRAVTGLAVELSRCVPGTTVRTLPRLRHACPLGGTVDVVDAVAAAGDGACSVRRRVLLHAFDACRLDADGGELELRGSLRREAFSFGASRFSSSAREQVWDDVELVRGGGRTVRVDATLRGTSRNDYGNASSRCAVVTERFEPGDGAAPATAVRGGRHVVESTGSGLNSIADLSWTFAGRVGDGAAAVDVASDPPVEGVAVYGDHGSDRVTGFAGRIELSRPDGAGVTLEAFAFEGEHVPRLRVTERDASGARSAAVERGFVELPEACAGLGPP